MSRFIARAALAAALFTAACSQTPAPVEMKGKNTYGKNGAAEKHYAYSSYESQPARKSSYQPPMAYPATYESSPAVSQSTQRTAAIESIGVSDLAPPKTESKSSAGSPVAASSSQSVNPWTGKQRAAEPAPGKPSAQLDKKNKFKPVKLVKARDEQTTGFMWPVGGKKIVSGFGPKGGGKVNDGINIASGKGDPVWASADGEVIYTGNELAGYGNMIIIKHTGDKTTTYAHLADYTVDKYDRVKQGDIIGYVGSTGNVDKPQLHFAVRDGKNALDPRKYLSTNVAAN